MRLFSLLCFVFLFTILLPAVIATADNVDDDVAPKPFSQGGGWGNETPGNAIPCLNTDTPYEQTHPDVLAVMLDMAEIVPGESVVYDLGSGDGRLSIEAARRGAKRVIGFERRKDLIELARRNARAAGFADDGDSGVVQFVQQDILQVDFAPADVVLMYLTTEIARILGRKFVNTLRSGSRVVTHDYAFLASELPEFVSFEMTLPSKKAINGGTRTVLMQYVINRENQNSDFAIDWDGTSVFELPARYYGDKIKKSKLRINRILRLPSSSSKWRDVPSDETAKRILAVKEEGGFEHPLHLISDVYVVATIEIRHKRAHLLWLQPYRNCNFTRDDGIPKFEVRITSNSSSSSTSLNLDWTPRRPVAVPPHPHDRPTLWLLSSPARVPTRLVVETRLTRDDQDVVVDLYPAFRLAQFPLRHFEMSSPDSKSHETNA